MEIVIRRFFENPKVGFILIDPLKTITKAHRFYERLRFEFTEESQFDESDCFVYVLKREKILD